MLLLQTVSLVFGMAPSSAQYMEGTQTFVEQMSLNHLVLIADFRILFNSEDPRDPRMLRLLS